MSQNIGSLKTNENGVYVGRIVTLGFAITVHLQKVQRTKERSPVFDIMGWGASREWVRIGSLFEHTMNNGTGETFLQGSFTDPTLGKRYYIAMFRQTDGTLNVAWSDPNRNRRKALGAGGAAEDGVDGPADDGLGDSTAPNGDAAPAMTGEQAAAAVEAVDASPARRGNGKAKEAEATA